MNFVNDLIVKVFSLLLETKNWWFWIDSRVLLPAPRSSFHNYENFDPTIVWQKFMSRLNDEVFLVLCVNRSPLNLIAIVHFFIKKNWKESMTDFTSKCKCFSWIEGFVDFFKKAIFKVSKVKLKNWNTPKYLGTYFLRPKFRLLKN